VDPGSPEDGIVVGLNGKDTKLCDDIEWIHADWKLNCARGTGFAPIESIEK